MNETWKKAPKPPLLTEIGSLPHHNADAALAHAFRLNIPFLPQIPLRNPREYMIAQALEGLPGFRGSDKGEAYLDRAEWDRGTNRLAAALEVAFRAKGSEASHFEAFEPSNEGYSVWRPFLWELQERGIQFAKIQLAGPLTSQWALRLDDGTPADSVPEIGTQVFRLVLARSIAMVRRVKEKGAAPIIYVDEPGFYCFSRQSPRHVLGLEELRLFLQALRHEGALVGLHCCSNTDWKAILELPLDIVSLDTKLSLNLLLNSKAATEAFLQRGGRLSLGVIPTSTGSDGILGFNPKDAAKEIKEKFAHGLSPELSKQALSTALFTPACGLALHKTEDAEKTVDLLNEFAAAL